jgi:hypothetical protein
VLYEADGIVGHCDVMNALCHTARRIATKKEALILTLQTFFSYLTRVMKGEQELSGHTVLHLHGNARRPRGRHGLVPFHPSHKKGNNQRYSAHQHGVPVEEHCRKQNTRAAIKRQQQPRAIAADMVLVSDFNTLGIHRTHALIIHFCFGIVMEILLAIVRNFHKS